MISAEIDGQKRPPLAKGESTVCGGCGGKLSAVMPQFNAPHWRHKSGDCDPWSEPEGPWHLEWKSKFDPACCEVFQRDPHTKEIHRADVLCPRPEGKGVVLELQHSSISEEERISREAFYSQKNRMFWLINMARNRALSFNFGISLNFERKATLTIGGKDFYPMVWMGRGSILEKWKGSTAHVFLNYGPNIYYLATKAACKDLVEGQKKGEFSIAKLTLDEFLRAVKGE